MATKQKESSSAIKVAFIGAAAAVIAAVIGAVWKNESPSPKLPIEQPRPKKEWISYNGRVLNNSSDQPIQGATVSLETTGPPQTIFSDSEGVYQFKVQNENGQVVPGRIRIYARNFKPVDRNVAVTPGNMMEEFRLERAENVPQPKKKPGLLRTDTTGATSGNKEAEPKSVASDLTQRPHEPPSPEVIRLRAEVLKFKDRADGCLERVNRLRNRVDMPLHPETETSARALARLSANSEKASETGNATELQTILENGQEELVNLSKICGGP